MEIKDLNELDYILELREYKNIIKAFKGFKILDRDLSLIELIFKWISIRGVFYNLIKQENEREHSPIKSIAQRMLINPSFNNYIRKILELNQDIKPRFIDIAKIEIYLNFLENKKIPKNRRVIIAYFISYYLMMISNDIYRKKNNELQKYQQQIKTRNKAKDLKAIQHTLYILQNYSLFFLDNYTDKEIQTTKNILMEMILNELGGSYTPLPINKNSKPLLIEFITKISKKYDLKNSIHIKQLKDNLNTIIF